MTTPTVVFDGDCGFCRWSAERLRRWDRAGSLRFVALQTPEADELLGAIRPDDRRETWHLVGSDGRVVSGGAAIPAVLDLLPGARPIAAVARWSPRATDRAYRWIAEHRATLGHLLGRTACAVDPTSPPDRPPAPDGRSSSASSSS